MSGREHPAPPRLTLPADHEGLAIFRETFLTALSARQGAGMRNFATSAYELVFGGRGDIPGVRRPPARAHLASLAADLRFDAVYLRSFAACFTGQDPGGERIARARRLAGEIQLLALWIDEEEEKWKKISPKVRKSRAGSVDQEPAEERGLGPGRRRRTKK